MFRSTLLLLMFVFGFGGCFRAEGPVELRGKSHLENYLCGREVWELHDAEYYTAEAFAQYWKFLKDGTFSVWVPNEFSSSLEIVFPDVFPKGTYRAEGQWKVVDGEDDFSVQLTDIIRPSSEALIPDAQLVIGWVDGKLRLLIGGAHYMRNMVVAEKQEEGIL